MTSPLTLGSQRPSRLGRARGAVQQRNDGNGLQETATFFAIEIGLASSQTDYKFSP